MGKPLHGERNIQIPIKFESNSGFLRAELTIKGVFTNYVDKISSVFDHESMCVEKFFTVIVDKNQHFLTMYVCPLVHVDYEQSLTKICCMMGQFGLPI